MDSGELDFYQHGNVCSNTCRSTKIDLVGNKVCVSSDQAAELMPVTPSSAEGESHRVRPQSEFEKKPDPVLKSPRHSSQHTYTKVSPCDYYILAVSQCRVDSRSNHSSHTHTLSQGCLLKF